jgi:methanogenic corrinoid protein MtbC1
VDAVARSASGAGSADGDQVRAWERAIITAAMSLDQRAVEAALDQALSALPALVVYDRLMVSVQRQVGEWWDEGRLGVAEEHLISQVVRARLVRLLHAAPANGRRHVVCACFPDEEHEVGLLGAVRHFASAQLGSASPTSAPGRRPRS